MFRRVRRITNEVRTNGIIAGLGWFFKTIYHRLVPQQQAIYFVDLTEINDKDFILPDSIEVNKYCSMEELDEKDYKILITRSTSLMGSAASTLISQRFAHGAALWLTKENSQLAGYRWTISKDSLLKTYIPHTEADVHDFASELFEEFRGKNILQISFKQIMLTLKKEGYKRCYGEVHLHNIRSVKAYSKTIVIKIGIAKRFNFFGRNVVIWYDMYNKQKEKRVFE